MEVWERHASALMGRLDRCNSQKADVKQRFRCVSVSEHPLNSEPQKGRQRICNASGVTGGYRRWRLLTIK